MNEVTTMIKNSRGYGLHSIQWGLNNREEERLIKAGIGVITFVNLHKGPQQTTTHIKQHSAWRVPVYLYVSVLLSANIVSADTGFFFHLATGIAEDIKQFMKAGIYRSLIQVCINRFLFLACVAGRPRESKLQRRMSTTPFNLRAL